MATPVGVIGFAGHGKDTLADILVRDFGYVKLAFAQPLKQFCALLFGLTDKHMYDPVIKETYLCDHDYPFRNRSEFRARIPAAMARLLVVSEDRLAKALAGEGQEDYISVGGRTVSVSDFCRQVSDRIAIYIEPLIFHGMSPVLTPTPRYLMQVVGTEVFRSITPQFWTSIWMHTARAFGGRVVAPDVRFMSEVEALYGLSGSLVRVSAEKRKGTPDTSKLHSSETAVLSVPATLLLNDGTPEQFQDLVREWAREALKRVA